MIKELVFASIGLATLTLSCTTTKKVVHIDSIQESQVINMKVGETYKLSMKENPTTGYSWKTKESDNCSVTLEHSYKSDKAPKMMVGVGGVKTYTIKAIQPGECTVEFIHGQSWMPENPGKKIIFKVD